MMILASDFDGTIFKHGRISAEDQSAIKRWQNDGNRFGIVTGRGREIIRLARKNGVILDYAIALNGALVTDAAGHILYEAKFDSLLREDYFAFVNRFHQSEPGTVQYALADADRGQKSDEACSICQFSLVLDTDDEANALTDKLNVRFGDSLVSYANGRCINTVKKGVSKATGIMWYAQYTGCKKDDIYVVGDNYNDLPMLTAYDGYCVNSACADMRSRVRNHCEDMTELTRIAYEAHKYMG